MVPESVSGRSNFRDIPALFVSQKLSGLNFTESNCNRALPGKSVHFFVDAVPNTDCMFKSLSNRISFLYLEIPSAISAL